jgi:hypothetical protein
MENQNGNKGRAFRENQFWNRPQVVLLLEKDMAQLSKIEKGKSKRYLVQQASTIKI